jgi:hypothetical protein
MYLQLLHYSQKDSLPVSLLHIELTGATLGATKINESKISLVFILFPQPEGGSVSKTFVSSKRPAPATSSSNSAFGAYQSSSTSAFDMALLTAGLAIVSAICQLGRQGESTRRKG